MKYCLIGAGEMSKTIQDFLGKDVVAVVDGLNQNLCSCRNDFDIIIDFSNPANIDMIYEYIKTHPIPLVIGTTGYTKTQLETIEKIAKLTPVVMSANFSLGVLATNLAIKKLAHILKDFDITIIEEHHKSKIDYPSGTALTLKESILDTLPNTNVDIKSIRAGNVVGNHTVSFYGEDEIVKIQHVAQSRKIFALGAIKSASLLIGKANGLYSFANILGEEYEKL